jgi:hypothetical protein
MPNRATAPARTADPLAAILRQLMAGSDPKVRAWARGLLAVAPQRPASPATAVRRSAAPTDIPPPRGG